MAIKWHSVAGVVETVRMIVLLASGSARGLYLRQISYERYIVGWITAELNFRMSYIFVLAEDKPSGDRTLCHGQHITTREESLQAYGG